MNIFTTMIVFLFMLVIILAANFVGKKYIFNKVRINKWIPLAIAIALFALQIIISTANPYVTSVLSIFAVFFFLWFMEITKFGGPKKKGKQIIIKPKAKPNRVKKNK